MLGLVIIAALPLLISASTNIELQASITDDHAAGGHYGFMAAFGFSVIGIGLLASLRPDGWRLTAWVGGLLAALLGLTSLVYPDITSSLPTMWAIAALAWGGAFITAAEYSKGPREPGAAQLTNGARQTAPGLPPSKSGVCGSMRGAIWMRGVQVFRQSCHP
jgi:hypothetical protein